MKMNDIICETVDESMVKMIMNTPYFKNVLMSYLKKNHANYRRGVFGINDLIHSGKLLIHGTTHQGAINTIRFRERKTPKHTHLGVHEYVNMLFKEKYGVCVRNGMFTASRPAQASSYGRPYMVIPTGDFTCYYNDHVSDFTVDLAVGNSLAHGDVTYNMTNDIIFSFLDYVRRNDSRLRHEIEKKCGKNIEEWLASSESTIKQYTSSISNTSNDIAEFHDSIGRVLKEFLKEELDIDGTSAIDTFVNLQKSQKTKQLIDYVSNTNSMSNAVPFTKNEIILWFDNAIIVDVKERFDLYDDTVVRLFEEMMRRV